MDLDRLRHTVQIIANHPDFPGKREAVEECLEELAELHRQGLLTADQCRSLCDCLAAVPARVA